MSLAAALIFEAGGERWALAVATVRQVLHLPRLARPPAGPGFLAGYLDLRGEPIPVLRLTALLGLENRPDELYTPVIVLKSGPLGLLVQSLVEVAVLEPSCLKPLGPGRVLNDSVSAEATVSDRAVHVLDPGRLLLEEEKRRLEELEIRYRERLSRLEEGS